MTTPVLQTGKKPGIVAHLQELFSEFTSLADTEAERRETFGCSAEHPWGLHMTRQARRLVRHLASYWEKQVADLCPRQDFFESKLELRTSLGFLKLEGP